MDNSGDTDLDHILVNMAGPIVEFAMVKSVKNQPLHSYQKYYAQNFATATDCFQNYAKDKNISFKDRKCAISVSAAINGDVVKIMRGNWTFSILGFSHLFGQKPIVINDAAALSWANLNATPKTHKSVGFLGSLDFTKAGKYLTILWIDGVGTSSLIVTDNGQQFVMDSEHGHTGFYPANANERRVFEAIRPGKMQVSWEHILSIPDSDPFWKQPNVALSSTEVIDVKAGVLGAFAGDATLSQTSWSGVFLYGQCAAYLNTAERVKIFQGRFESKGGYRMNLRNTPRWLVNMEHQELLGCAAMLVHR